MPEGHTIHRIANRHRALFVGKQVMARSPQGRFDEGARRLDGRVMTDVDAYGKHLVYRFEPDALLHVHLGLVGSFRTHQAPPPAPSPATRLVLQTRAAAAHLTGPMTCRLIGPDDLAGILSGLGPDPLRPGTRVTDFVSRVESDDRPIGTVLLDQSVIAGVGNVYRAEVLFVTGTHPATPASSLEDADARDIWATAKTHLTRGVEDGRIITVSPRDVGAARRAELPRHLRLYVYKREHKPCLRCRTPIASMELAGRRTWFCPSCQTR